MSVLGDLLATVLERGVRGMRPAAAPAGSVTDLTAELVGNSGEVSGMTIAGQVLDLFESMDRESKLAFFHHLARDLDIDAEAVRTALEAYEASPDKATYRAFARAAEPRRQELIRRLNQRPGSTARLVAMRAELLSFVADNPDCAALDLDFRHLFASWFNRGFLVLSPVNWNSPADLLEKIIAYEAVHAIDSWDDLRARLKPADRRCFAFFHPAMPGEPLIFVEVALTRGIPGAIHDVLTEDREVITGDTADTAVFYSISNCQAGLAGVSFGNSLIKQVAHDLAVELPGLKTFVTLSPIPGLSGWLDKQGLDAAKLAEADLRRYAAAYLLNAKAADGKPRDPVARFHLGNGASVHAIHSRADLSPRGLAQSGGAMVNYLYDLDRITQNHELYAGAGAVAASSQVQDLAQTGQPPAT